MARRNATDRTPAALLNALDYIEENTGLMGDDNPGDAKLSAGGTTLMVTSDRTSFDHESHLLEYFNEKPLRFQKIGWRSSDTTRSYVELKPTK